MIKRIIENVSFWIKFFLSKDYAWDFKIANFVMRDYLRNYLVIDRLSLKVLANKTDSGMIERNLRKIIRDIEILMKHGG